MLRLSDYNVLAFNVHAAQLRVSLDLNHRQRHTMETANRMAKAFPDFDRVQFLRAKDRLES